MNKNKKILLTTGILGCVGTGAYYIWKYRKQIREAFWDGFREGFEEGVNKYSEPENSKPENLKPDNEATPDQLFKEVVEKELEEGEWKNERDFLSRITKEFIKEAKSIDWIDSFPVCLEDLMTRLSELGLEERFEKDLEQKYMKGEK